MARWKKKAAKPPGTRKVRRRRGFWLNKGFMEVRTKRHKTLISQREASKENR